MNVPVPVESVIMQFPDQFNRRIFRVLQKLLKYFNSTATGTYFELPAAGIVLVILALNLNDSESVMLLKSNHLLDNVKHLLDYTLASQHPGLLFYLASTLLLDLLLLQ